MSIQTDTTKVENTGVITSSYRPCAWGKRSINWFTSKETSFVKKAAVVSIALVFTAAVLGLTYDKYTSSRTFANFVIANVTKLKVGAGFVANRTKAGAIFAANKLVSLKGKIDFKSNKHRAIGAAFLSTATLAALLLRFFSKKKSMKAQTNAAETQAPATNPSASNINEAEAQAPATNPTALNKADQTFLESTQEDLATLWSTTTNWWTSNSTDIDPSLYATEKAWKNGEKV